MPKKANANGKGGDDDAKFDMSQYTDGNMADLLDEEKSSIQKDKAEFMYAFEGAMSVIQETEEPEDEIAVKASA